MRRKPLLQQAVQDIAHQPNIGVDAQADGAGIGAEIGGDAVGYHREDRHTQWRGGFNGHPFRQYAVHAQAQIGMLFRTAQGHHRPVVVLEIGFDLHPIHLRDTHGVPVFVM